MYREKILNLISVIGKEAPNQDERDKELNAVGACMEELLKFGSASAKYGFTIDETRPDVRIVHELEKACEAMVDIDDLCTKYGLDPVFNENGNVRDQAYAVSLEYTEAAKNAKWDELLK